MGKHDPRIPRPPVHASRHRRWRIWYDMGEIAGGNAVRITAWRGKSPSGDQVEAFSWNDVILAVDEIEDALGRDVGDRLPLIAHTPPRERGSFRILDESELT